MPMFHSLMQQFLAAESDSKLWLLGMADIVLKPLMYKHSELFQRRGDRTCESGYCKAAEWTINELALRRDFGG